jgi:hypothetical protein
MPRMTAARSMMKMRGTEVNACRGRSPALFDPARDQFLAGSRL